MKKSAFALLLLSITFASCSKKAIQTAQTDMLMQVITDGTWYVFTYTEAGVDITANFANYFFKFNTNTAVDGSLNGTVTSGTWSGSISTQTIVANFPGAGAPLRKLNGTWLIKDSYLDYVKAELTVSGVLKQLYLKKRP